MEFDVTSAAVIFAAVGDELRLVPVRNCARVAAETVGAAMSIAAKAPATDNFKILLFILFSWLDFVFSCFSSTLIFIFSLNFGLALKVSPVFWGVTWLAFHGITNNNW